MKISLSMRFLSFVLAPLFAVAIATIPVAAHAATVQYQLNVINTWSVDTHPGDAFPTTGFGHFSWLGGATHNSGVSFWSEGSFASPGTVRMAERGNTATLIDEVDQAIVAGSAGRALDWRHWFCPSGETNVNCGATTVFFNIDTDFPLVTLATMIGPSPDWFVGVSGLALFDGTNWLTDVLVDLFPYDGGSQSANIFELTGDGTADPTDQITLITANSGQLVGPGSLGSMRFTLIAPIPLPAAFPLFATALAGMGLLGWRRKRKASASV